MGIISTVSDYLKLTVVYAKYTLNPKEVYYQPRVRNVLYGSILLLAEVFESGDAVLVYGSFVVLAMYYE